MCVCVWGGGGGLHVHLAKKHGLYRLSTSSYLIHFSKFPGRANTIHFCISPDVS